MKRSLLKFLPLLLCGMAIAAHAASITGQINIQSGSVVLTPNELGAVTAIAGSNSGLVTAVAGNYPMSLLGDVATYKPFMVALGNQPIAALWTVSDMPGGYSYSFDLSSITSIIQTPTNLFMNGAGVLSSSNPMLDATAALWTYGINSADGSPTSGFFSFQSNNVASGSVPDGADTLMLLGLGLIGLVGVGRMSLKRTA